MSVGIIFQDHGNHGFFTNRNHRNFLYNRGIDDQDMIAITPTQNNAAANIVAVQNFLANRDIDEIVIIAHSDLDAAIVQGMTFNQVATFLNNVFNGYGGQVGVVRVQICFFGATINNLNFPFGSCSAPNGVSTISTRYGHFWDEDVAIDILNNDGADSEDQLVNTSTRP